MELDHTRGPAPRNVVPGQPTEEDQMSDRIKLSSRSELP
jgi:hypothetical protein